MEDPREGSRLEQKIDPEVWVPTYFEPHLFPGAQVLDVGCGPGRSSGWRHPRTGRPRYRRRPWAGSNSTGQGKEPRQRARAVLSRRHLELQFGSGTFDVVYSRMLLQYVATKRRRSPRWSASASRAERC